MKKIITALSLLIAIQNLTAFGQNTGNNFKAKNISLESISSLDTYQEYVNQGAYFIEQGQYKKAKYLLYKATKILPDNPEAYIDLAVISIRHNNLGKAFRLLKKAILNLDNSSSRNEILFYNLGLCFQKLCRYQQAGQFYERALNLNPRLKEALFNSGIVYAKVNNFGPALVNIVKARTIFKQNHQNDYVRKADELLIDIINTHANDSSLAKLLLIEGSNSFDNKKLEEAIALLKVSTFILPNYRDAYYRLGVVYSEGENFKEALKCFSKAVELDPNFSKAYINLGGMYGKLKKYDEALSAFDKALKIEKDNPKIYYNMAIAYEALGKKKNALRSIKQAEKICLKNKDKEFLEKVRKLRAVL
jgi:tetratricopeptide (TPR) repeat protein